MLTYQEIFIRLCTSLLLGGFIGIEREGIRKPAGLRTHILVCLSSTLIMLTGIYISNIYVGISASDPSRLGAQVISGIGFLGAGTILKVNNGVKGLTTAASLWSVAGIGLACGVGFYIGAISCTFLILFSLKAFSKIERLIKNKNREALIEFTCKRNSSILEELVEKIESKKIYISLIESNIIGDNQDTEIRIFIIFPKNIKFEEILNLALHIDGIKNIKIEQ